CHALPVDILDEHAMAEAIASIARRFGRIDGVVNAVGAEAVTAASGVLAVHLTGALRVAKAVGPILQQQGFGTLLNLTSIRWEAQYPCGILPRPRRFCSARTPPMSPAASSPSTVGSASMRAPISPLQETSHDSHGRGAGPQGSFHPCPRLLAAVDRGPAAARSGFSCN